MSKPGKQITITLLEEKVVNKIYVVRDQKVMLNRDLTKISWIIRVFTKMKEMLLTNQDILLKLEKMEKDVKENKGDIAIIFSALKQLLNPPQPKRKLIGFNRKDE